MWMFCLLGLGFNIKGGKDVPFIEGDPGIFVCKIRDAGAAVKDGRLKEGDLILEVNIGGTMFELSILFVAWNRDCIF